MIGRLGILFSLAGLAGCAPALHKAALEGRTQSVLAAIDQRPASLDACGMGLDGGLAKASPLTFAAWSGRVETVKALLARGADVEGGGCGGSPLWAAVWNADHDTVKALIEAGAEVNRHNHRLTGSLLHMAHDVPTARLLIESGVDTSQTFHGAHGNEYTPAAYARHRGLDELARYLEQAATPEGRARAAKERASRECGPELRVAEHEGDVAAKTGRADAALRAYSQAYLACPEGHESKPRLFAKLLDVARLMSPRPEPPREALDHFSRAEAHVKLATDRSDFAKAAAEYGKAVRSAPWWPEAYFNQGLAREKAGDLSGAIESLKRFLLAAPKAPEAGDVRQKIVELEVALEKRGGAR